MKQVDFYKSLSKMEDRECIEKFLIYNASLVISGVKPSATVTIIKDNDNLYHKWIKYGREFLKNIDIQYIDLRENDNALIILIYNKAQLGHYLLKDEHRSFLIKIGYSPNGTLEDYLAMLKVRYKQFNCPHELGIFLGFPLDDVRDFMECSNKKCLQCGYWLVYNNLNEAKKTFSKFDKVKEHTVNCILKGQPSNQVASNVKKNI